MTNLPTFVICKELNAIDQGINNHLVWFGIKKQSGYTYDRLEDELERRIPYDDIIYFGDCEGLEVFYPLQHFNEDGHEIEPIIFLD